MNTSSPLLWIIVLSVVLRIGAAVYLGDQVAPTPGAHDQVSYDALARRVVAGHGFSFGEAWWPATRAGEPTAHWSYLQVLYLAAVYSLVGLHPIMARLGQAVIAGVLQPWLTWRIGKRLFGPAAGLAAAAISAIYAYFVYYAGALMTETFHILALLWILDLLTGRLAGAETDREPSGSVWTWASLGVALAVAALARQVALLLIPALIVWTLWDRWASGSTSASSRRLCEGLARRWLAALLVLFLVICPFTVRNYKAFGQWVLLNTNAGFALYWANHPLHGTSFQSILEGGSQAYFDLIPVDLRNLNEGQLNSALLKRGLLSVTEDPARFFWLSMSRFKDYFKFWPSQGSTRLSNLARVGSFGLFLPLILVGVWWAARDPGLVASSRARKVSLLLIISAIYAGIHLVSWSLVRYRLPVDALLIVFAGLGLSRLPWAGRVISQRKQMP